MAQQVHQRHDEQLAVVLAARQQHVLDHALLAVRQFLVVLRLLALILVFSRLDMGLQQLEQQQPLQAQLRAVGLARRLVQLLQQRLLQLVHVLLAAAQEVLDLLEFQLLGALLDAVLDAGGGGRLVCLLQALAVVRHALGHVLPVVLGQHDVLELHHLRRDDAEDGVQVVQQQVREVVRDHVHHALQALLHRAERLQVFQRVLLRQVLHERHQLLQQRDHVLGFVLQEGEELLVRHHLEEAERDRLEQKSIEYERL